MVKARADLRCTLLAASCAGAGEICSGDAAGLRTRAVRYCWRWGRRRRYWAWERTAARTTVSFGCPLSGRDERIGNNCSARLQVLYVRGGEVDWGQGSIEITESVKWRCRRIRSSANAIGWKLSRRRIKLLRVRRQLQPLIPCSVFSCSRRSPKSSSSPGQALIRSLSCRIIGSTDCPFFQPPHTSRWHWPAPRAALASRAAMTCEDVFIHEPLVLSENEVQASSA